MLGRVVGVVVHQGWADLVERARSSSGARPARYVSQLTHRRTNSRSHVPASSEQAARSPAGARPRYLARRAASSRTATPVFESRGSTQMTVGAGLLAFHDSLRVRVEVVAGLEMGADEEDHLGVGEVGRRAIEAHPRRVAEPGPRRADVGVRVVAVDAPRVQHALDVAVVAWPADVVQHLVVAAFTEGASRCGRRCRRALRPTPLAPTARSRAARYAAADGGSVRGRSPGSASPDPWRSCARGSPGGAGCPPAWRSCRCPCRSYATRPQLASQLKHVVGTSW